MDQRVNMVSLGVADVPRARTFYEQGLGWRAALLSSKALVVFRAGGLLVTLIPRGELADDLGLDDAGRHDGFSGTALSYAVASHEEAVLVMARAERAGAMVTRRTGDTSWGGHAGCFTDPDGHAWEVVWNPDWFDEKGRVLIT